MNNYVNNARNSFSNIKSGVKKPSFWILILVGLIILLLIIYFFVRLGMDYNNFRKSNPFMIYGTRMANQPLVINGNKLKPSYDQQYGIEFTYSFWIYIDGDTFKNLGKWKHIMHKGNSSSVPLQAPGFWLYPNENKMAINMNTYDSVKTSCDIGNLPLNKWFLVTTVLTGQQLDVFVNAKLKKRCNLGAIPKQNYGNLYITKWGGFSGFLSQVRYYNYALPFFRIEAQFKEGPSDKPCTDEGVKPPYLAPDYWMTTGFPNTIAN
jgi:hypothetical protein